MIKVAICDDEEIIACQLESLISDISVEENVSVNTEVFFSGNKLEKEILKGIKYDLIYMDIQMQNGDGITAAKNIRKVDEKALLIYVSGYEKYMIELFRLDVFAFIRKPIENNDFKKIFLEAYKKICNQKLYFTFYYKNQEYKIPSIDILYFESNGRKINIYSRDGSIECFNGKLSEVETRLGNGKVPFLRIHQSYLVNYHHIRSRSKTTVTLIDGTKLPISEDRQKIIGKQYSRLLKGEMDV